MKSPYFTKRKRSPCSASSICGDNPSYLKGQSSYFRGSTLAVRGCVDRLGSLILSFTEKEAPSYPCQRSISCKCCSTIVNDAMSHFYSCDLFRSRYESYEAGNSQISAVCLEKANSRILYSARHLCPKRCYLRAFSPVRESLLLQKSVRELREAPLGDIFSGWKCKLDPRHDESLFICDFETQTTRSIVVPPLPTASVCFVSPDGKRYTNKNELAKLFSNYGQKSDRVVRSPRNASSTKKALRLDNQSLDHCDRKVPISDFVKKERPHDSSWWYISEIETPLGLLEELFCREPWQLLVSAILLNRTSRIQVDAAFYEFLRRWPDATTAAKADPEEMSLVIQPLGLRNKRANGIIRFSKEYICLIETKQQIENKNRSENCITPAEATSVLSAISRQSIASQLSREDILGLFYCGEYVWAAYQLFIRRDLRTDHPDTFIQFYVEYQKGGSII